MHPPTKGTNISTTEKENLTIKINELYNDESIIGQRFRQAISANPEQLFEHAFPESSASISHVAQYSGTTSHQLTMLYNNIKNPEKIESALVADIIGEKVTINLFGEGANRGKDGLQIHKALTTVITEFSNINKLSPREILESPDFDKIITKITNEISAKTKYTTAGLATSGIYLPDNAITKTMIQDFTEKVNLAAGDYKLTSQELSSTQVLATSIASNLFGKEAETTHVADIAQIEKLLIKTLYTIKEEHPNLNLENALTTNRELLVGSLDRGYLSTTGEGMTKLFYDQCNYSGTALSAGIKSSQFRTNLKEQITESIQENIAHSKVKPIKKSSLKTIIPPKTKLAAKDIGAILGSPNSNTTNKKPITKVVPKSKGR